MDFGRQRVLPGIYLIKLWYLGVTSLHVYPNELIILFLTLQLYNGTLAGGGCDTKVYVPDVYLMSIILFLGTFTISIILKDFKNSLFFPSKVC